MLVRLHIKKLNGYFIKRIFLFYAFFLSIAQLFAHGDLSIRIAEKTIEISENPNNFKLYFERGLLYQQHLEYSNALEDYRRSQSLGNTDKTLHYQIAEVHYLTEDYNASLKSIGSYLELGSIDVKAKKLEAQILFHLKSYKKSLDAYRYVINNMIDIRPEDVLEYSNIILAENNKNYKGAIAAIESGLDLLGPHTLSLQLKKLDYLKDSGQTKEALEQYNYFILEYNRKEFWYYKKAKYLAEIDKPHKAFISLKLAMVAIEQLDAKFRNMNPVIKLKEQIKSLESSLTTKNYD
ncbi:hypothetical protein [Arenibacter sp. F20364]|uniref:tetratricopeptide repeat protein n=1 Tax=Arenibacter sp. F20364 TaxID=2926415 RepID=UPI001FF200DF|nr:hypothetical protein [Arenibacter sp. F20364]MCK0189357.1 hypothetical protein [Arenibacter sp. F20364]